MGVGNEITVKNENVDRTVSETLELIKCPETSFGSRRTVGTHHAKMRGWLDKSVRNFEAQPQGWHDEEFKYNIYRKR